MNIRRMALAGLAALALAACASAPGSAPADQTSANALAPTPRLPARVEAPPQGAGRVYAADPQLAAAGYEEREYLVSGTGNIYTYDDARHLKIERPDQPYTTRILVRYPRDPARFSGVVIFDIMHPEAGLGALWLLGSAYIKESGDAYVQVLTRREPRNPLIAGPPSNPVIRIKAFDPVRYAAVDISDGGLTWDIVAQVGRLIRTDSAENPLRAYRPRQMIAGGHSGSGALTLFYVNEGFAAQRMPDGSAIFDGYLIGEPSWYPRVNSTIPVSRDLPDNDPRQRVAPRSEPAIQLYTMDGVDNWPPDMWRGRERPDSDAANDRFRQYVVAGATHGGRAQLPEIVASPCDYPTSTFPLDHYFALSLDQLKRWGKDGFTPPHAAPLQRQADGHVAYDADRNPLGGVRSTALDVPIASHFFNTGSSLSCSMAGAQVPFTPARLRALYGTEAAYVARVRARADQLVAEGWLLPYARDEVVRDAQQVRFNR
ncbi:MAG: alpha/beta hydrolase domain-containing protein [Caulobacterales bacterium]